MIDESDWKVTEIKTPGGLPIRVQRQQTIEPRSPNARPGVGYLMNHVSIRTPKIAADHNWFTRLLGSNTVLADETHFNPLDNRMAPERHLWCSSDYYITLREYSGSSMIDHVGWMAGSTALVDSAAYLLDRLGFKTVLGPLYIDGSYLVHFRGPDERVHDFFYPTSELGKVALTP